MVGAASAVTSSLLCVKSARNEGYHIAGNRIRRLQKYDYFCDLPVFFIISFYILLTCFSQVALTKWMKKTVGEKVELKKRGAI